MEELCKMVWSWLTPPIDLVLDTYSPLVSLGWEKLERWPRS